MWLIIGIYGKIGLSHEMGLIDNPTLSTQRAYTVAAYCGIDFDISFLDVTSTSIRRVTRYTNDEYPPRSQNDIPNTCI